MGEFDCYCAICGGSLTGGQIGDPHPGSLRLRRQYVRRQMGIEEDTDSDEQGEDSDEDEEEDLEDLEGENSYDPRLVSEESLDWLQTLYCLGFNPDVNKYACAVG